MGKTLQDSFINVAQLYIKTISVLYFPGKPLNFIKFSFPLNFKHVITNVSRHDFMKLKKSKKNPAEI